MASLTLMLALKARGSGPALIAREMALGLGDGSFAPDLAEHLPGVSNVEADLLSRRFDLFHQPWQLPELFAGVRETKLPPRPRSWYLTLGDPPGPAAAQAGSSGAVRKGKEKRKEPSTTLFQ